MHIKVSLSIGGQGPYYGIYTLREKELRKISVPHWVVCATWQGSPCSHWVVCPPAENSVPPLGSLCPLNVFQVRTPVWSGHFFIFLGLEDSVDMVFPTPVPSLPRPIIAVMAGLGAPTVYRYRAERRLQDIGSDHTIVTEYWCLSVLP